MFAGPGAIDDFIQEIYAKNPVRMKRTHGFEICLNPEDRGISPSIGVLGWYELRTTELFIEILRKGDTVVDVGANVGFFTLLAASIVGQRGTVLSFEPEPTSFSLLSESIRRNNFSNVILLQKCVSEVDGERTLHLSGTSHKGLHSIVHDSGGTSLTVPSTRLDTETLSLGIDHIDLLKIDAEGAEPEILTGAMHLLSENRVRSIILEWEHPEAWLRHKQLVGNLLSSYDAYQVSRSLPFLPVRKLRESIPLENMFQNRFGTNLYLRLRE